MHQMDAQPQVRRVVLACQGGSSHTAFTAGALKRILQDYRADDKRYAITGLSGTSGGAICALLVWFGLTTGGSDKAVELLDRFWKRGLAAQTPWEAAWNVLSVAAARTLHTEPGIGSYNAPLQSSLELAASWRDTLIRLGIPEEFAGLYGPRRSFVNMDRLLEAFVDFGQVERIGQAHRSIFSITRLLAGQDECSLEPASIARLEAIRMMTELADQDVRAAGLSPAINDAWAVARQALDVLTGANRHYGAWPSNETARPMLAERQLQTVSRLLADIPLPTLLVGAVDVLSGQFKAFDSRRAEINQHSVIASMTLPQVFVARPVGNSWFWDGMATQNPPLRPFFEEPDGLEQKPDEIWLIQIDALDRVRVPRAATEIEDRRNELTGNLSLHQELYAIETVNRWLGKIDPATRTRYKHVDVSRIQIDPHLDLDHASKINTTEPFISGLMAHGEQRAAEFLPVMLRRSRVREFVECCWNRQQDQEQAGLQSFFTAEHRLHVVTARGTSILRAGPDGVADLLASLGADTTPESLHVVLDDMVCDGQWMAFRWTMRARISDQTFGRSLLALPQPDRSITLRGFWISRHDGDGWAESWVWHTQNLVPAPPPLGARVSFTEAVNRLPDPDPAMVVRMWFEQGLCSRSPDTLGRTIDHAFAAHYEHHNLGYRPESCDLANFRAWSLTNMVRLAQLTPERFIVDGGRVAVLLFQEDGDPRAAVFSVAGGRIQQSWWTWDT
jgi:predicted acylesterase/phospholipase RssA